MRERVVAAYRAGKGTYAEIAELFGVEANLRTVRRCSARERDRTACDPGAAAAHGRKADGGLRTSKARVEGETAAAVMPHGVVRWIREQAAKGPTPRWPQSGL